MKLAATDYRAFGILLVPAFSRVKRIKMAFADPGHAASFGADQAASDYPNEPVEVIVIRNATREVISNVLIQEKE